MNKFDFSECISRMCLDFKKEYGANQIDIILRDVKSFTKWDMNNVVDQCLINYAHLPSVKQLRMEISLYREKKYSLEEKRRQTEYNIFNNPTNYPEEVQYKTGMIKRRLSGDCSDNEWNEFMVMLEKNTKLSEGKTKQ